MQRLYLGYIYFTTASSMSQYFQKHIVKMYYMRDKKKKKEIM